MEYIKQKLYLSVSIRYMYNKEENMVPVTVLVEKTKKEAFLSMLQLLSFVKLETKAEKIKRYTDTAPDNINLNESEVLYEVKAVRNKKARKGARSKA